MAFVLIEACGDGDSSSELNCDSSHTVCEELGSVLYYLVNDTGLDLTVQFVTTPQLGSRSGDLVIKSGATEMFFGDSIFGVNPRPSDTFASLSVILNRAVGKPVAVYRQEPVDDSLWVGGQLDGKNYGRRSYQLTISVAALALEEFYTCDSCLAVGGVWEEDECKPDCQFQDSACFRESCVGVSIP